MRKTRIHISTIPSTSNPWPYTSYFRTLLLPAVPLKGTQQSRDRSCLPGAPETKLVVAALPVKPLALEAADPEDLAAVLALERPKTR